ncbi:DUF4129 domain-containing protein [Halosolutus gelatinilyticus]|uniref:DUF4129 domain-containing protein n=1 Tax=Halosolutus gelatinilyticus TaxID=2931975 RepID=UPI001FF5307E|nr:DUF4129 domain-containing protein [Halosolutus gelatinilyticus]
MSDESAREGSAGSSVDYRQVSFVALAALALIVAAFFAPGVTDERSPSEIEPGEPDPGSDGGGGGSSGGEGGEGGDSIPSFDWFKFFDWFDGGGSGEPVDVGGESDECVVTLEGDRIPGSEVTANVYGRGEPITDVQVWFNDRSIGRTDELGRVTGEVPYVETLEIRVGTDGCTATEATSWASDDSTLNVRDRAPTAPAELTAPAATTSAIGAAAALLSQPATRTPSPSTSIVPFADAAARRPSAAAAIQTATEADESNSTVEYEVEGDVSIDVRGEPYPGETVAIDAAIEGVPMPQATVSVDGDPVAETDETGTATITVPDDGTDRLDVTVARGDFAGKVTVDVLVLEARIVPDGLAPVPGSDGHVAAVIDGDPVGNATVAVGGEERGRTDADGLFAIELPRDPTATVTVSTDSQTATVTLVGQYGALALVTSIVTGAAAAVTYRTHGRRGPVVVLGIAAGLLVVLVAEAFYGPIGGLVALGAAVAVGAAAVLVGGRGPQPRKPAVGDAAGGVVAWLVDRVLAAVGLLETLVDRCQRLAGAVRTRLSSVPRSVRELRLALFGRLRSLPERAIDLGRRGFARLRAVPIQSLVAVAGAVALLAAGFLVRGPVGVALVAAALAIGAVYVVRSGRTDEAVTDVDSGTVASPMASGDGPANEGDRPSFRELWRSFAREVAPGRWRTRTPGEIERAALDAGYPRESVRELTTLFREVEYGDRPLSEAVRARADEAYRELQREGSDSAGPASEEPVSTGATGATDGGDRP